MKHSLLAFDIFHLMRMSYYGASILGRKWGYKGGLTVLDWNPKDYGAAKAQGLLKQSEIDWANELVPWKDPTSAVGFVSIPRYELANRLQKQGLNVGRIQDALYKDLVGDVPILGRYNRFLFDKLTRGIMMQSAIHSYEKLAAKFPKLSSEQLARQIAKEINVMYGNLGRQGIFKSRTAQDLSRMVFLAPQWVESLIRKEVGLVNTPIRALMGKTNILGKAVGAGTLTMFAITQALNMATRGHPTWENEEEGHKLDAWIPNVGSEGDGFFISPLSIFAEITHDMIRMFESKPTAWEAVRQIGENKLGPWGRIALIAATQETPYGQKITSTGGTLQEIGKQLVPTPIGIKNAAQEAIATVAPNVMSPPVKGAVQRQFFGTLGVKIEPAQSDVQQIGKIAQRWLRQEGLGATGHDFVPTDEPSYSKLRAAARNNDLRQFRNNLVELLKTKTPQQIVEASNLWARRPFTGSEQNERRFLYSLSDEERELWARANEARMIDLQNFLTMLAQEL